MRKYGSRLYRRGRTKTTVEDCQCLDINALARDGILQDGLQTSGGWALPDRGVDEQLHIIAYKADLRDPLHAHMRLRYIFRHSRYDHHVPIVRTRPNYGGVRLWFLCPVQRRRVAKLYRPPSGGRFASRQAHGLAYNSQSEGPADRAIRKKWKIARKIGGINYPQRPKGMHHATFERLWDALQRQDDLANRTFMRAWVLSGDKDALQFLAEMGSF